MNSRTTITIPSTVLEEKIGNSIFKKDGDIRRKVVNIVQEKNKLAFENMMENFENDPITQEIEQGASASNISQTLGGYGNLFSFIGFNKNENPIANLRNILQESSSLSVRFVKYFRKKVYFEVELPNKELIFSPSKTPMPDWLSGTSWVYRIEHGVPGLNYYLKRNKRGRSGGGIQIPKGSLGGKYHNRSYITALLKKYIEFLRK